MKLLTNRRAGSWILLAASLAVSLGFWHWTKRILAPANTEKVVADKRPIGNNSDLYPRWLGARELLLRGRDPYSPEITREAQIGFYGRPLDPHNPGDPAAREAFVYPLYVVFLIAPTVTLPFRTVAEVFRWLLLASIAISVPLWMRALGLRPAWGVTISGMVLALSSNPAIAEYFQQNLAALAILFVAAAAAAATGGQLALSGLLLALATIKPDTTGLMVLWFLLWAGADWKGRGRLLWAFGVTMMVLVSASEMLSAGWIRRFLAAVREYPSYGADPSILRVLLPRWLSTPVGAVILCAALYLCWKWRRAAAGSANFGWALAWVGAVTLAVLPKLAAYNELLLLPSFVVLLAHYHKIARLGILPRALTKAAFTCQLWQWLAAPTLAIAARWLTPGQLRSAAQLPLYTSLALSPVTLLAVAATTWATRGSFGCEEKTRNA